MVKFRGLALLGFTVVACLVLLTLQTRGQSTEAADLVALVTTPAQTVLARVNRAAFGLWSTYLDWKNMRAENQRLREEVERLRVDGLSVQETRDENRRLRRLLDLREHLPLDTLAGEVIAREWGGWVRSITVNRGRADHVAKMAAVISPDGLIGRVVDVRAGASVVQVLTDPASTVGGHVVRTRTPGIVEGDPKGTLRFKYMSHDRSDIQVGDLIVTSGEGGVFPRGIPVGRVRSIDARGSALFHYATLTPVVDFAKIDDVLLLRRQTSQDLAGRFSTGD